MKKPTFRILQSQWWNNGAKKEVNISLINELETTMIRGFLTENKPSTSLRDIESWRFSRSLISTSFKARKKRIKRTVVSIPNRSRTLEGNKEPQEPCVDVLPVRHHLSINNVLTDERPACQVVKVSGSLTISF